MNVRIGIDIGGTNTKFGLIGDDGQVLNRSRISTTAFDSFDTYMAAVVEEVRKLVTPEVNLLGIGIGAPNGNVHSGMIEFAPNMPWKSKLPVRDKIREAFTCPVELTNDANAAAMGEKLFGGAKHMNDFIVITLGTGVGSGIYINGKLAYGHDGFAGEIGHVITYPGGRLCGCGRRGCIEAYVNAKGILRTLAEEKYNFPNSELAKLDESQITTKVISEYAEKGDELAMQIFEKSGEYLGLTLANSMAYTSPEAFFLFGGITKAGELLREPIHRHMEANMLNIFQNKVKVLFSELPEDDAAILGAAALVQ
jgi:glucokinase